MDRFEEINRIQQQISISNSRFPADFAITQFWLMDVHGIYQSWSAYFQWFRGRLGLNRPHWPHWPQGGGLELRTMLGIDFTRSNVWEPGSRRKGTEDLGRTQLHLEGLKGFGRNCQPFLWAISRLLMFDADHQISLIFLPQMTHSARWTWRTPTPCTAASSA